MSLLTQKAAASRQQQVRPASTPRHLVVVCDPPVDSNSMSVGGTMGATYHRTVHARRLGYEVTLLTGPEFPREPRAQWKELVKRLSALEADHIHIVTQSILGCLTLHYCHARRIPVTADYHTLYPEWLRSRNGWPEWLPYAYIRWFFNGSTRVLPVTPSIARLLTQHGVKSSKIAVARLGLDHERFKPEGPPAPEFETLPRPIWINVAHVEPNKGVEDFYRLNLPGTKVQIGDGSLVPSMKKKYPDVIFLGPRPQAELPPYYRAADCFVFPSRADSCGMAPMESIACGTPVAAYPVMGPIDVVTDPRAGCLNEDLKIACEQAVQADRIQCRQFALEYPSWEQSARQWLDQMVQITNVPRKFGPVRQTLKANHPLTIAINNGVRSGAWKLFGR